MWVALLLCTASVVALWTALGRRPLAAARAEETLRAKAVPALREAALCATLMMRVEGAEEVQAEFAHNEKAVPRKSIITSSSFALCCVGSYMHRFFAAELIMCTPSFLLKYH